MEVVNIFISYSHENKDYFNEFKKGIEDYSKNTKKIKWNIWSDVEIPVGTSWHEVIQDAVKKSNAAILLISQYFFVSNYIKNEEFLKFVEKNKNENFTFFPILLSDCDYNQWEELTKIQFFNPQGQDYDIEKFKNKIVPYDYIKEENLKCTYYKNCVAAFEQAILSKQNKQQELFSQDNKTKIHNMVTNKSLDLSDQIDKVARVCKKELREKLFFTLTNSDLTQKEQKISLDSINKQILSTSDTCILCVRGEPGTGKSTLLSLLYLDLLDNQEKTKKMPLYIDLHKFEHMEIKEATYALAENIDYIRKCCHESRTIVIIDGISNYRRDNEHLEKMLFDYIAEPLHNDCVFVYGIGTAPNDTIQPPFIRKNLKLPKRLENPIIILNLKLIDSQKRLFYQTCEILLKINDTLPTTKMKRSLVIDKLRNLANTASGNFTDFRTINFLIERYKNKETILNDHVGEIYLDFYATSLNSDLFEIAEKISLYTMDKSSSDKKYTSYGILYKSQSIRNFMLAYFFVHSILKKNYNNLKYFDCILPPCVNNFAKSLINHEARDCTLFIDNILDIYKELSINLQTQILYFFGRVKFLKDKVTNILQCEYELLSDQINCTKGKQGNEILMKYRTTGISLIYIGQHNIEDEFYKNLIFHPNLRRINRLFHVDYYTNDSYRIGEDRDLDQVKCTKDKIKRLYDALYNTIKNKPEKGEHSYFLSIITLLNLVAYDHYRSITPLSLYKLDGFEKLLRRLVDEKAITNQVIKNFIMTASAKWEKPLHEIEIVSPIFDDNIYRTIIDMFYQLKKVVRTGWLKEGRRIQDKEEPESVADHTWGACLLAMILLSDDINLCSFMRDEDLTEYKDYKKSYIINLLIIHDLAESYTGDIFGSSEEKSRLENEFNNKLRIYDSFPYFRSFNDIYDSLDEYNTRNTINAKIAYDIDKLEAFLQAHIYYNLLDDPKTVLKEWKNYVDNHLLTTLGRKIFEFLTKNIMSENYNH